MPFKTALHCLLLFCISVSLSFYLYTENSNCSESVESGDIC